RHRDRQGRGRPRGRHRVSPAIPGAVPARLTEDNPRTRHSMQWSDIPFDPPRKTLRQFAGLWIACFGGLALWQAWGGGPPPQAITLGMWALGVGPIGLVRPEWLRPVYVAWMVLAFPIGWTVSQVVLAILFYGLFTPIGLVFRLIGRDPLQRSRSPGPPPSSSTNPPPPPSRPSFLLFC